MSLAINNPLALNNNIANKPEKANSTQNNNQINVQAISKNSFLEQMAAVVSSNEKANKEQKDAKKKTSSDKRDYNYQNEEEMIEKERLSLLGAVRRLENQIKDKS